MEIRGAILDIGPVREISEKFSVQEIYLDTSNYNNMTGEKYENAACVQINNGKVDVSSFKRGDMVTVKYYLNGRFFERKDGSGTGFMQTLTVTSMEKALNTAKEPIVIPEDQLTQVEIPQR